MTIIVGGGGASSGDSGAISGGFKIFELMFNQTTDVALPAGTYRAAVFPDKATMQTYFTKHTTEFDRLKTSGRVCEIGTIDAQGKPLTINNEAYSYVEGEKDPWVDVVGGLIGPKGDKGDAGDVSQVTENAPLEAVNPADGSIHDAVNITTNELRFGSHNIKTEIRSNQKRIPVSVAGGGDDEEIAYLSDITAGGDITVDGNLTEKIVSGDNITSSYDEGSKTTTLNATGGVAPTTTIDTAGFGTVNEIPERLHPFTTHKANIQAAYQDDDFEVKFSNGEAGPVFEVRLTEDGKSVWELGFDYAGEITEFDQVLGRVLVQYEPSKSTIPAKQFFERTTLSCSKGQVRTFKKIHNDQDMAEFWVVAGANNTDARYLLSFDMQGQGEGVAEFLVKPPKFVDYVIPWDQNRLPPQILLHQEGMNNQGVMGGGSNIDSASIRQGKVYVENFNPANGGPSGLVTENSKKGFVLKWYGINDSASAGIFFFYNFEGDVYTKMNKSQKDKGDWEKINNYSQEARTTFTSVDEMKSHFTANPIELKSNLPVLVSRTDSDNAGDSIENDVLLLQWTGEDSPESFDENLLVGASLMADVSSLSLGEAHTFSSGGQNVFTINQISKSAFTSPWSEIGDHSTESGRFVNNRPKSREYGELEYLEIVGSVADSGAVDYNVSSENSENQSLLGVELVAAETYSDRLSYVIKATATGKVVYKQTFNVDVQDGDTIDWWFNHPVDSLVGDDATAGLLKADNTFLKVRPSQTGGEVYRKLKRRKFEINEIAYVGEGGGGARPSVESMDILMFKESNTIDVVIKADFMQPNYKLHGLPTGFIQENIRFSEYKHGEANTCTISVTPPPQSEPIAKTEIFFGSEVAKNWRGTITIEIMDVPPITLAELKAKIANNEDVSLVNTSEITDMSSLFSENATFNQDISDWDTSNVTTMDGMFYRATAFNQDIGNWDVSKVTTMFGMFSEAKEFNQNISAWDVSNVTDMYSMFYQVQQFNQDLSKWDVSKVTTMYAMFLGAQQFNQPIGNWDVSNVTDMGYMFSEAKEFNQNISAWDVSKVTNATSMFEKTPKFDQDVSDWKLPSNANISNMFIASGIREEYKYRKPITLAVLKTKIANNEDVRFVKTSGITDMSWLFHRNTTFNQDISRWDTSNVTTMRGAFNGATAFNQDIGNWNTSKVTDMGDVFGYATNFNQDIGKWDTSNVTNFASMFNNALKFNQDISKWDTSKATNMYGMFNTAIVFNQDIGNWDVSNATSMAHIFEATTAFDQDVSRWNINKDATTTGAFDRSGIREEYKFRKPITLDELKTKIANNEDVRFVNTSEITDMSNLFLNNQTFNQDISSWNTSNVTTMEGMFNSAWTFNQDISNWDTSKVTNMKFLFHYAQKFNQDLSKWDTSNVTDMYGMFYGVLTFNQDIGNWDTSKVTNMNSLFYQAEQFNQDLSKWDVSNVTDMYAMFYQARQFNQPIGNWDVSKVTNTDWMFGEAINFNQDISKWDLSQVPSEKREYMFTNCPINEAYKPA